MYRLTRLRRCKLELMFANKKVDKLNQWLVRWEGQLKHIIPHGLGELKAILREDHSAED